MRIFSQRKGFPQRLNMLKQLVSIIPCLDSGRLILVDPAVLNKVACKYRVPPWHIEDVNNYIAIFFCALDLVEWIFSDFIVFFCCF
jgi:hypothetical protein